MAFVKKGDVFVPEMLEDAIRGTFAGMTVMAGTGAAILKTGMPAGKANVGEEIKVPFFDNIGELEDLAADGDALTPRGITDSKETATVKHSGIAIQATWWAQAASASDPYAEMAKQVQEALRRRIDKALIDTANAAGTGLLTKDVYSAGTPRTIDYDLTVDGRLLWGDEAENIAALVTHSKVVGDIYKLKDSTGRSMFVDGTEIALPRFAGAPVFQSDRIAASSDSPAKYTTLMIKRGSLVFWVGEVHLLTDKDILADTDVAALHVYWACHRYKRHPSGTKCGVVKLTHN